MKKIVILSTVLMSITGFSFAATTTVNASSNPHPNVHQTNITLKSEYQQVLLGEKDGKITTAQGDTLKADLKSVRTQEVAFIKENGNHELTSAQTAQLNATLSSVEQTLTTAGVPVPTPSAHH
jgi:Spy/CpxP family protein refolding chaperone